MPWGSKHVFIWGVFQGALGTGTYFYAATPAEAGGRQEGRKKDRQTDRQTERETERQTDIQTDRQIDTKEQPLGGQACSIISAKSL